MLHLQIPKENSKRRLDVLRRNSTLHNRQVESLEIQNESVYLLLQTTVVFFSLQDSLTCRLTLAGSEAMFADLGHFSQLSIKVLSNSLFVYLINWLYFSSDHRKQCVV